MTHETAIVPRNERKEQARLKQLALQGKIKLLVNWPRNAIEWKALPIAPAQLVCESAAA